MTPHISWFSHHRKGPLSGNVTTTGYDRDEREAARPLTVGRAATCQSPWEKAAAVTGHKPLR
jgi:hypothetical protein